jgi:hypothetical protein
MAYVGPENSLLFREYLKASCNSKIRDLYKFVHTFDYANVNQIGDSLAPAIVFFRNFNNPETVYIGQSASLAITKFAFAKAQPLVKPFSQEMVHEMFVDQRPAIILFQTDDRYVEKFTEAARFFEEKFLFVTCEPGLGGLDERLSRLAIVVLTEETPATIRLISVDPEKLYRFQPDKPLAKMSADDIVLFIFAF